MKTIKKILKWIITIVLIPVGYFLLSLLLTFIPVNTKDDNSVKNKSIYLESNGIHLNIIIAENQLDSILLDGLKQSQNDNFYAFGWGDRNFYLNTPTWDDLTYSTACRALFIKSSALIRVNRYSIIHGDWTEIKVNQDQLNKINRYIYRTFSLDSHNKKIKLNNRGYSNNDNFYEAMGSFTCFNTCNSWVNSGLKESDIKACLWTPFDFGLLNMHKK
ncbi:MAG: DUF2459 domain-containing protein [Bacteroidota bacterium]